MKVRQKDCGWQNLSRVVTIELACPTCGVWRGEMPEEQDWYPSPVCTQAAKVCHILEGFTRRAIVTGWRQVAKPVSVRARTWIMTESFLENIGLQAQQRRQRRENDGYIDGYKFGNRRRAVAR